MRVRMERNTVSYHWSRRTRRPQKTQTPRPRPCNGSQASNALRARPFGRLAETPRFQRVDRSVRAVWPLTSERDNTSHQLQIAHSTSRSSPTPGDASLGQLTEATKAYAKEPYDRIIGLANLTSAHDSGFTLSPSGPQDPAAAPSSPPYDNVAQGLPVWLDIATRTTTQRTLGH